MSKLDILNRKKFVDQLVSLIENISNNKTSTCFAINGEWGSGKSFVLDKFEEELNGPYSEKYFVVRYNCWKYDYYEEPLIAIVSTIISEIEEKENFFPDSQKKQEILGMFKAAGVSLLSLANTALKTKTGIDFKPAVETIVKGKKEGAEKFDKEHAYDAYLGLNKVIDKLSELLADIAERYTVVIIVDELDRCIPDYAIKVLERLHHLTEEKKNIITVVAVDKEKLEKSVENIFGFEPSDKYLDKFFNFEIKLDKGEVSEKITEKYVDYIALFDRDLIPFTESIDECIQAIFKNIDARTQEHLVRKAMLVHKLLYSDKKDYSFMCVELIIVVMYYIYNYDSFADAHMINDPLSDTVFKPAINSPKPHFDGFFKNKFKTIDRRQYGQYNNEPIIYVNHAKCNLYSAIYFLWYYMHDYDSHHTLNITKCEELKPVIHNAEEIKKFVDTLKLLK
ncbi:MAG: AAA family ATPase [Oscillospiraceae bacterium]|nr:AAA family ATPase [Oscillospiraceae bacterium]